MPSPGKHWYHIILNTNGSWLPGDPRGFRSRKGKKHSSGDYKNPPPEGEHAGLHRYARQVSGEPVFLRPSLRPVIGQSILRKIKQQMHTALVICVGSNHAHILCELPGGRATVKRIAGAWKQAASHKVRMELPGKVWAAGGDPIPIKDKAHQRRVYEYILRHKKQGAWVWSFRDG